MADDQSQRRIVLAIQESGSLAAGPAKTGAVKAVPPDPEGIVITRPMMDADFLCSIILGEPDLRGAIEPQGEINRISHGNEITIDLVGPDIE